MEREYKHNQNARRWLHVEGSLLFEAVPAVQTTTSPRHGHRGALWTTTGIQSSSQIHDDQRSRQPSLREPCHFFFVFVHSSLDVTSSLLLPTINSTSARAIGLTCWSETQDDTVTVRRNNASEHVIVYPPPYECKGGGTVGARGKDYCGPKQQSRRQHILTELVLFAI